MLGRRGTFDSLALLQDTMSCYLVFMVSALRIRSLDKIAGRIVPFQIVPGCGRKMPAILHGAAHAMLFCPRILPGYY